jgi:oxygen-dependent protoporphyrinogen oxidase
MQIHPFNLMIVGGGISGLSAAYYAKKIFEEQDIPVNITLIEKGKTLGGKIQTVHRDGFVIERGPDSFLSRRTPIIELSKELGLDNEWVATNPKAKKTYILHKGSLHRIPPGLILGVPTQVTPFIKTGLISPLGKLRAGLDLLLPKRQNNNDESLGHFLERRLGREVVTHIAEPLLSGIYAGDAYGLSLQTTFPQLRAIEKQKRSLILGMLANKNKMQSDTELPNIAKESMFLSYQQGLSSLVKKIEQVLHNVDIRTNQSVVKIRKSEQGYRVDMSREESKHVDALILAVPAYSAANLLPDIASMKALANIPYVSVANVVMAFNEEDLQLEFDGSGFVVPRKESRYITACTWTSSKWMHVAPKGKILLRAYVGRSGAEEIDHLDDGQILQNVQHDLQTLMGITAKPTFYEINRWPKSMPQYPVGHTEHIQQVRDDLRRKRPGIYLCGAGYQGVGIPDCIRQGKEAAEQSLSYAKASTQERA